MFHINFERGFDDFYLIHKDVDLNVLKLQYEEVKAVKWASLDRIMDMLDEGIFVSYHKNLIKMLFDMKDYLGAHRL